MGGWLADQLHARRGRPGSALVLGLAFKENVPDLRNSRVTDVVSRLTELGHQVTVHDPLADPAEARHEYGIELASGALSGRYDLVVIAVPHAVYGEISDAELVGLVADGGLLADPKNLYGKRQLPDSIARWTL
jgi:UDP-N-acetyl-D-galactosamine dehydrogenase